MTTKSGFTLMSIHEFETWIDALRLARTILTKQDHHTYSPRVNMDDRWVSKDFLAFTN